MNEKQENTAQKMNESACFSPKIVLSIAIPVIIYDRGAEIFCHAFVGLGQFDKFYGGFGKRGEHDGGTPVSELPGKAKIIHIDPVDTDFYIRLTNFYAQFAAIGRNYTQVVEDIQAMSFRLALHLL